MAERLELAEIHAGFIPLVDCAPLIVARELAFDRAEGFRLHLHRETSWANIRDRLNLDRYDCAHMLAPMPIAATLGIAQASIPTIAPMKLGINGNAITASIALFERMRALSPELLGQGGMQSARALAQVVETRKRDGEPPLTLGMVYPFSCHNYELRSWLAAAGVHPDRDVRLIVLPPPLMVDSLKAGHIDGCCVGAPWNSYAIGERAGCVLTHKNEVWPRSPEKVLGVKAGWAERHPNSLRALIRALDRAMRWLDAPDNRKEAAKLLALSDYIDLPEEVIGAPLSGRVPRNQAGDMLLDEDFQVFHRYQAGFPWHADAVFLITQMIRWGQIGEVVDIFATARQVYRPDLYREALDATGAGLPDSDFQRASDAAVREFGEKPFDPSKPLEALEAYRFHSRRLKISDLRSVNPTS